MQTTVILGAKNDYHALHMLNAAISEGLNAILFDTSEYPGKSALSWTPSTEQGYLFCNEKEVSFRDICSVFWSTAGHNCSDLQHFEMSQAIALNDSTSMLKTFFMQDEINWCNSWNAMQFHKIKPRQLSLASQIGLSIPPSYIGNDAAHLRKFIEVHGDAIFKPVYGGAHCARITPQQLTKSHLTNVLKVSPVTIQKYIPGTNVRTYVIADEVFSAKIQSEALDYRTDLHPGLEPIDVPRHITEKSIGVTRAFGMKWTAIDWRVTDSGQYYFLEANPSPMFIHFEQHTGYPITRSLLKILREKAAR